MLLAMLYNKAVVGGGGGGAVCAHVETTTFTRVCVRAYVPDPSVSPVCHNFFIFPSPFLSAFISFLS